MTTPDDKELERIWQNHHLRVDALRAIWTASRKAAVGECEAAVKLYLSHGDCTDSDDDNEYGSGQKIAARSATYLAINAIRALAGAEETRERW